MEINKRNPYLIIYLIAGILGFIILTFFSCDKSTYLPIIVNNSDIKGTWIDQKYPQNKITITDSTIIQVGFPLVAGDDIRGKDLKYTYRGVIFNQPRDSFKLRIIELKGNVLNLEIDNYYGTRDKIFIK